MLRRNGSDVIPRADHHAVAAGVHNGGTAQLHASVPNVTDTSRELCRGHEVVLLVVSHQLLLLAIVRQVEPLHVCQTFPFRQVEVPVKLDGVTGTELQLGVVWDGAGPLQSAAHCNKDSDIPEVWNRNEAQSTSAESTHKVGN